MTIKESFKERYSNGKRSGAIWHIIEIVAAACIVSAGGIIYGSAVTVPKLALKMETIEAKIDYNASAAKGRMDAQLVRIQGMEDCLRRHLEDSARRNR